LLTDAILKYGYYVQKLTFVRDGQHLLNVKIIDAAAVVIAELDRDYDITTTHADGFRRDTDGDGLPDLVEAAIGLDALESNWNFDSDGNGWSDFDEWLRSADIDPVTGLPRDSDEDGWSNFDENLRGTNPNDDPLAEKRFKDYPAARRLYEVESVVDGDLNATATVAGMTWSHVRADDINGQQYYDSKKLLTVEEITSAGQDPAVVPARSQITVADNALATGQLPVLRLPAGDSMVVTALHEQGATTQVYKHWLYRSADMTPLQFYQTQGAGSWNTADEWKEAYLTYLQNGLLVTNALIVNLQYSTMAVTLLEAFISHEARLYHSDHASIQLFGNDASPINGELIKASEDALINYIGISSTFDDLLDTIKALTVKGQPLFDLENWVVQQLSSVIDNVRTDQSVAEKFIKSFDVNTLGCYVEQSYLDQLAEPGNETLLADFNLECPDYYTVADLQALYAADQQRLYLLRLLLIPDGYAQYQLDQLVATPTLHDMIADTDSDGSINREELFFPLIDITLPWLDDRDGDGIADGDDACPFDPENLCSNTPVLPFVITTDSVVVYEPATGESFVLISYVLDKPANEDVIIYYQT
ncbi:MAG: hypothetical protein KAT90_15790, partial [Gammaproteobacteria bacterium]|nr:hypothetical protein [Gammaproteobacteria bacterium]